MSIPIVDRPPLLTAVDPVAWPEETSVVIVGGGPVGLSAALLLAQRGVEVILLERRGFDARFPRAHLLNVRTMEVFETMGVASDIYAAGPRDDRWHKVAWYTSIAGPTPADGVRLGAVPAWGGGADAERYRAASPSRFANLPQLRIDPLLYAHAAAACPGRIRAGQEVVAIEQDGSGVVTTFEDRGSGVRRRIRSAYVVVADGGRASGELLGVEMEGPQAIRQVVNYHVTTDLSMWSEPDALLAFFFHPSGGPRRMGTIQALGPGSYDRNSEEWLIAVSGWLLRGDRGEDAVAAMREVLGLPVDHPITLHSANRWVYNGVVAKRWRYDRVFIAGDAAHRHPPTGGLGLNSGIQDADNLAWKLAAVIDGSADDGLLDSYERERRPTAAFYTAHSLENATRHAPIGEALGLVADEAESRRNVDIFLSATPEGEAKRAAVAAAVLDNAQDYSQLNVEAGYHYWAGAFVPDGSPLPAHSESPITFVPTTRPGHHLPHAWLHHVAGSEREPVSTRQLVRPAGLTLFVGESRLADWRTAVAASALPMHVSIVAIPAADEGWWAVSEVSPEGAVLVRPDAKNAWRVDDLPRDPVAALDDAIAVVMRGGDEPATDPAEPYFARIRQAAAALVD